MVEKFLVLKKSFSSEISFSFTKSHDLIITNKLVLKFHLELNNHLISSIIRNPSSTENIL